MADLSQFLNGGGFKNRYTATSNGSFALPANITTAYIIVTGGGGGGGGGPSSGAGGDGGGAGGAGGTAGCIITVPASSTISYVIGAAGLAGAIAGNGGDGGTSVVYLETNDRPILQADGGARGRTDGSLGIGGDVTMINYGFALKGADGGVSNASAGKPRGLGMASVNLFSSVNIATASGGTASGGYEGGGGGGGSWYGVGGNGGNGNAATPTAGATPDSAHYGAGGGGGGRGITGAAGGAGRGGFIEIYY